MNGRNRSLWMAVAIGLGTVGIYLTLYYGPSVLTTAAVIVPLVCCCLVIRSSMTIVALLRQGVSWAYPIMLFITAFCAGLGASYFAQVAQSVAVTLCMGVLLVSFIVLMTAERSMRKRLR